MFALSVVVFVTGLVGLVCLIAIGSPMVRASERQFGLQESRDALKKLRGERGELHVAQSDLAQQKRVFEEELAKMTAEQKQMSSLIGKMPQRVYDLTFELGSPEGGMQAFDFVLSRQPNSLDLEKVTGPERQLWQRQRTLRVWSRSLANAQTTAEKRYPEQNGFIIRNAVRVEASGER
jgi:hypothetical protein